MKLPGMLLASCAMLLALALVAKAIGQEVPKKPPTLPPTPRLPGSGSGPGQPGAAKPGDKSGEKTANQLVQVSGTTDVERIEPGGKFLLAFIFTIEPAWHTYWANAGASGAPTEIAVSAPAGFVIGKTLFPRPQIIKTPEGDCYGYEGKTVIFVEVTAPHDLSGSSVMFNAKLNWLVCREKCLLGNASIMVTAKVGSPGLSPGSAAAIDPAVAQFKKRLPTSLAAASGAQAACDGTNLTIRVPSGGFKSGQFFPLDTPGVEYGKPAFKTEGETLIITVPVTLSPVNAQGKPLKAAGVVGLGENPDDPAYEIEVPLAAQS